MLKKIRKKIITDQIEENQKKKIIDQIELCYRKPEKIIITDQIELCFKTTRKKSLAIFKFNYYYSRNINLTKHSTLDNRLLRFYKRDELTSK